MVGCLSASPRWHWSPWLTVALGLLITLSPWFAALILGAHFAALNAVVVGAAVAIGLGIAGLMVLVVTLFRPT